MQVDVVNGMQDVIAAGGKTQRNTDVLQQAKINPGDAGILAITHLGRHQVGADCT